LFSLIMCSWCLCGFFCVSCVVGVCGCVCVCVCVPAGAWLWVLFGPRLRVFVVFGGGKCEEYSSYYSLFLLQDLKCLASKLKF